MNNCNKTSELTERVSFTPDAPHNLITRETLTIQRDYGQTSHPETHPQTTKSVAPILFGSGALIVAAIALGSWCFTQGKLTADHALAAQVAASQAQLAQIQTQLTAVQSLVCGGK